MAYTDFTLAMPADTARQKAGDAMSGIGYKVSTNPNGSLYCTRGNKTKTLLIGALAGKDFFSELTVELFPQGPQNVIARVTKDTAGNALKGGAIGASKSTGFYQEAVEALRGAFAPDVQLETGV